MQTITAIAAELYLNFVLTDRSIADYSDWRLTTHKRRSTSGWSSVWSVPLSGHSERIGDMQALGLSW